MFGRSVERIPTVGAGPVATASCLNFLCGRRYFLRGTRLLGPLAAKSKFGAPPCL